MHTPEFKARALKVLEECNGSCDLAARKLKVVCARTLHRWRCEQAKPAKKRYRRLSASQKRAVAKQLQEGASASLLADDYGVSITTIYNIRNEYCTGAALAPAAAKGSAEMPRLDPADLPDDVEELRKRCLELEMDNAILRQAIGILKKDPSVDPSELTNREKTTVVDALKAGFSVSALCERLRIPRCSYYYARNAAARPDKYSDVRRRVRAIFERSRETFGSERIWGALRRGDDGEAPTVVSEKAVRRLMREEGLSVIYDRRKRAYSSYKGEVSAHPGNLVKRDFHAGKPNEKWLTDITQLTLPGFKCYLSVIVDCFDGKVVSHRLSRSPDAELANSTLLGALECLEEGESPILHSDCGCHYRWPGWISICARSGVVRSMSKKACSPDNAACEGFFGRLKNEFFYYRDWDGIDFDRFDLLLGAYIDYYNNSRRKKSLGWMSPAEYRLASGYAA